ncbi:MAG: cell division protein FtsZ [Pseudomonadota bacterium]
MPINLTTPDITELKPRIIVFGVGGAGGNAVNNMITSGLNGVDFVCANTDAQALASSSAGRVVQMGTKITEGLGAGSQPEVGRAAAEECIDEINDHLQGTHMVFITAGMGGGTGTGAGPVIARAAREMGILTVGVVTKPFQFEGQRRAKLAESGIEELQKSVDTLIVIPNQNLFRVANEQTTFADAFAMADQVLYSGVACITDLMVKEGLINLDFADVRSVMRGMGKAMMGTGEASGDNRAVMAAEAAIANPLLDETTMNGARGLLISITGGRDLTLYEVDSAATRISDEVDPECNVILGATFDESLEGVVRVSVVATGIDANAVTISQEAKRVEEDFSQLANRLRAAATPEKAAPQPAVKPVIETALPAKPAVETPQPVTAQAPINPPMPVAPVAPQPGAPAAATQPAAAPTVTVTPPRPAMTDPDVTITHMSFAPEAPQPKPEPETSAEDILAAEPTFIPPVAARPDERRPRMPRIEDFPQPAREALEQHYKARETGEPAQQKRPGLLERLSAVGLGRREGDGATPHSDAPTQTQMPEADLPEAMREFAKPVRPAKHQPQVTNAPRKAPQSEEDQYEIPAFLRRQAN